MMEETVGARAAARTAEKLRAELITLGAATQDLDIVPTPVGVQLRGVRSAGVIAEFGTRARAGLRRMARAIEALRSGGRL
jgi:hypothetical protein